MTTVPPTFDLVVLIKRIDSTFKLEMSSKKHHKEKTIRRHYTKEEKPEEPELPKYRDRAKERREDQNPDYEITELTSFHAVAPPGNVDLLAADAHKLSIEKSKYLGGDVEHTHLVKGLDYALLNKVRSEIKKPEPGEENDGKPKGSKDDRPVAFRTASAKSVYQWIVKPQTVIKTNEMFLPGRMAFIYNMENGFSHDIPTTVHRSKADCPVPEEMVTVSVDGSVLDRIAKIMTYLRLGSSGKVLKKKKKDKDAKGKTLSVSNRYEEDERVLKSDSVKHQNREEILPPPPPLPKKNHPDPKEKQETAAVRKDEDDIFVGEGIDYSIPSKDMSQSPISEDMEESPRNKEKNSYFAEPAYGPVPPPELSHGWQEGNGYDVLQAQALASGYQGEWQNYQYAEQMAYPEQYNLHDMQTYDMQAGSEVLQDPRFMTQEEKDRGLGSVFKRDDQRLQQLREKDSREKDPNFVSESYSECYPGYQEYNREVVDSDDEDDLTKMDMGGRAKGRLHRWDFETEEEWASYNEQKEAMPKAAFQFGVKMQDGRKTRKQNRDQKLTNDLHKINKILARKKAENGEKNDDGRVYDDESHPGKKLRV
ncbi:suppressor of mec-8 and unc-52 protein homolog 2 [Phtheirospermum japonicum]|uniref:Suppressor of mec-8 and unc-52 protein homolog 2 n=1 Tax=Phtheirospermum japonicum TaxID=374723 RepID=A0A830CN25_9LAMI|nr:suppressor of mec-8 and unc-52 protein homolog 2 [Phtheirospermum japonicum]